MASEIDDKTAIKCIVGESENQWDPDPKKDGMRAHASAIRNRGTIEGVYGCRSKRLALAPAWVWERAAQAWEDSASHDYVNGADHFGAVGLDGKWIKRMDKTMTFVKQVKDVRFYKAKGE